MKKKSLETNICSSVFITDFEQVFVSLNNILSFPSQQLHVQI